MREIQHSRSKILPAFYNLPVIYPNQVKLGHFVLILPGRANLDEPRGSGLAGTRTVSNRAGDDLPRARFGPRTDVRTCVWPGGAKRTRWIYSVCHRIHRTVKLHAYFSYYAHVLLANHRVIAE